MTDRYPESDERTLYISANEGQCRNLGDLIELIKKQGEWPKSMIM